jgi:hypothetical protein
MSEQFLHDPDVRSTCRSNVENACRKVCQPRCTVNPTWTAARRMQDCPDISRLIEASSSDSRTAKKRKSVLDIEFLRFDAT